MNYISTRDSSRSVTASYAIANGISKEGGLFVPENFPQIPLEKLSEMAGQSYQQRAEEILSLYLTDFSKEELHRCVQGAYSGGKFADSKIAPLVKLYDRVAMLELWHGPTCAFKDMALQLLPHMLTVSASKEAAGKEIVILVATSGDTGKAALEGFRDVEGTRIMVFYPNDGVSDMQKLQMVTQLGENVSVCAIEGNFDDAQTAVKKVFTDPQMADRLAERGMMFSSANSINWGRLVPQIVYYFSSYAQLLADGEIRVGDPINVVVPTGNFGNILAAYYAMKMGLPVKKFICASNANNVLSDFIHSGVYDRNRPFYTTISPSMDILISSNLERLLFDLYERNDSKVRETMGKLSSDGRYVLEAQAKERLSQLFWGGYCDDASTMNTIAETFQKYGYLCDTHTAVAVRVYQDYVEKTGDRTQSVIASTASPFKFCESVIHAISPDSSTATLDEFEKLELLQQLSGRAIPQPLADLRKRAVRFENVCTKEEIPSYILRQLDKG